MTDIPKGIIEHDILVIVFSVSCGGVTKWQFP